MLVTFFKFAAQFFHWTSLGDFFVYERTAYSIPEVNSQDEAWAAICPGPNVRVDDRWINSPICLVFYRQAGSVVIEVTLERLSNLKTNSPGSFYLGNIVNTTISLHNNQFDLGDVFNGLKTFYRSEVEPTVCFGSPRLIDMGGLSDA